MSSKKKSHGVLFTPYLQKGEDLIWVGMPARNPFISPHTKQNNTEFWPMLMVSYCGLGFMITLVSGTALNTSWFFAWAAFVLLLILLLLAYFISGLVRFGKTYYAITTKRLLILRRHFWSSLDADLLMLLPVHHLHSREKKTASIQFEPLRIDEVHHPAKYFREASVELVEVRRSNLENLSQEDAETANELLTAAKNDMLDARARQLGLMD